MSTLNAGSNDNDETSQKHPPFAALEITGGSSCEGAHQVTDGVNSVNDTGGRRALVDTEAKVASVLRIRINGSHQGSVITVDAGI